MLDFNTLVYLLMDTEQFLYFISFIQGYTSDKRYIQKFLPVYKNFS